MWLFFYTSQVKKQFSKRISKIARNERKRYARVNEGMRNGIKFILRVSWRKENLLIKR